MSKENIFYTKGKVTRQDRRSLLKQKGLTVWLTGLSGSGKTTIALELEQKLFHQGLISYVLDGDNIRHGLSSDLSFSNRDRKENIRRVGETCCLFADSGLITIASFISPYKEDRKLVRTLHEKQELPFFEIFVNTPIEICEEKDIKGLYKKARAGKIKEFTGINSPYETPNNPDLILSPYNKDAKDCCDEIIEALIQNEWVN